MSIQCSSDMEVHNNLCARRIYTAALGSLRKRRYSNRGIGSVSSSKKGDSSFVIKAVSKMDEQLNWCKAKKWVSLLNAHFLFVFRIHCNYLVRFEAKMFHFILISYKNHCNNSCTILFDNFI